MAVKSVAARTNIAASGAASGDTINIIGKNETWAVTSDKLLIPTSALCIKLSNGNYASLSVKDTFNRNEPSIVPDFSNTASYAMGQAVRRNNFVYYAKQDVSPGSFDIKHWHEMNPGSNGNNISTVLRMTVSTGAANTNNGNREIAGILVYMFYSDKSFQMTLLKKDSTTIDHEHVAVNSTFSKAGEATVSNLCVVGQVTTSSHIDLGTISVTSGTISGAGRSTVVFYPDWRGTRNKLGG